MSRIFDRPLVITSHSLVNVWTTGHAEEIFGAIPFSKAFPVCMLREPSELEKLLGGNFPKLRDDLETLIARQVAITVSPETDAEWVRYYESSTNHLKKQKRSQHVVCAIAPERTWTIVSDEPIMRKFGEKCVPRTPVVSTLALIHNWRITSGVSEAVLHSALLQAKTKVHFRVMPDDPLFDWWTSILME